MAQNPVGSTHKEDDDDDDVPRRPVDFTVPDGCFGATVSLWIGRPIVGCGGGMCDDGRGGGSGAAASSCCCCWC